MGKLLVGIHRNNGCNNLLSLMLINLFGCAKQALLALICACFGSFFDMVFIFACPFKAIDT
jgi:hypothetical protein